MLVCSAKWKFRRKSVFYNELKGELDMHSVDDLAMCLGDINGHIDMHIDGFDEIMQGMA